jgi:hypothetical protein
VKILSRPPLEPQVDLFRIDSIGKAGFSHDFASLKQEDPPLISALDFFSCVKPNLTLLLTLSLAPIFPIILKIPTEHTRAMWTLKNCAAKITCDILERAHSDPDAGRSMVGALSKVLHFLSGYRLTVFSVKSEAASALSHDEVMAQVCAPWFVIKSLRLMLW